ncbi:hypothetical protein ABE545_10620 [Sphingobacterium faecium]|jgi:predicted nuclease with TOPRIM domain|uniref:hypothetical protein n=1 Tax=Sphingobacterium faecium TaxID=34087 RepID=UPI00320A8BE4
MTEVYLALAAALGAFLTKAVEWIFNRKKDSTEVEGKEIDNDIKLADYYKVMLDDLQTRYEKKYQDIEALYENKERILKDEIALLNRKVKMLKTENMELRKRVKELEAR